MSLASFAEHLSSINRSAVTFSPERCLHTQDQASSCAACFDICPAQAITAGAGPVFDAQKCQACLACLPVCPTGAYAANDAVPQLLANAARLETPQVELICSLHPQPNQGISDASAGLPVRGCLAGLGAGAGMALAASGFEHIIYRCEACADCPWKALVAQIRLHMAELQQLLTPWKKSSVPVVCSTLENPIHRPLWKAEKQPVSRRDFFRMAIQPSKVAAAPSIDDQETAQPHQPGRDRLRKLKAAAALGEPLDRGAVLPKSDFVQLYASNACTACGVCARVCPTKAMEVVTDDGKRRFNLVFYPQNCVNCGFCVRSCAPNALHLNGLPRWEHVFRTQKPVLLQAGDLVRCERCNTMVAAQAETHLCPLCQFRQSHPFGSKIPPGLMLQLANKKNPRL